MNLKRKILDLKNTRKAALDSAQSFLDAKDMEKYNTAMAEIETLNAEIEANEKLLAEEEKFPKTDPVEVPKDKEDSQSSGSEPDFKQSRVDAIRSGNEYVNAWVNALRHGANVRDSWSNPVYAPLYAALKETGGTPEGADGGFLVPIDVDNTINELKRQFLDLSSLFNIESVSTLSGWRVVDEAPTTGFTAVNEMANIPKNDQPKFAKLEYKVVKYGMILPISNELLDDNAANLMAYVGRWFAKKGVITTNNLLLALLKALTPVSVTAGDEVKAIKDALNKTLDPAIAVNAVILTNQSGFNALDLLTETTGKPLMQPDITNPTQYRLKGKRVVVVSDANLPLVSGKAPVFVGDYKQFATLFERKPFEMATTTIGGDAWVTDSTEVRGIMRYDAKTFDAKAAAYLQFALTSGT